ncbi:hypothetical protein BGZ76_000943 [Entomortierella beljakovae]|nr:hypothetical protein BGZ76_000943 [Entomortierella beljakovae]
MDRSGVRWRTLENIGQWTRHLSIFRCDSNHFLIFGSLCRRLESISLSEFGKFDQDDLEEFDLEQTRLAKLMFRRNRASLSHLHLLYWRWNFRRKPAIGLPLWNPLLKCASAYNLRSLKLEKCKIRGSVMKAFWTIAKRLEILELLWVAMDIYTPLPLNFNKTDSDRSNSADDMAVRFPLLKHLSVKGLRWSTARSQLLNFIAHCPQLRKLYWRFNLERLAGTEFVDMFVASVWPQLEYIDLTDYRGFIGDDDNFRVLQSSKVSLRRLTYGLYSMEPRSYEILRERHFSTIGNIDLSVCDDSKVSWIIEILTSCPCLEIFQAKSISAQQILDAGSFVCLNLERLTIFIDMEFLDNAPNRRFTEEEFEICRKVYQRLAIFKGLKKLDMLHSFIWLRASCSIRNPRHPMFTLVPLPFRLKAGLDELSSLKELREFCFWAGSRPIQMEELIWVTENWINLTTLTGSALAALGSIPEVKDNYLVSGRLKDWLEDHEISTGSTM